MKDRSLQGVDKKTKELEYENRELANKAREDEEELR